MNESAVVTLCQKRSPCVNLSIIDIFFGLLVFTQGRHCCMSLLIMGSLCCPILWWHERKRETMLYGAL